jgi:DNA-binding transcriptional LysR family regulator
MPLPQPLPDLGALDLLVSVGELGSISAAAELHRVTQPAASMRIRSLERALGLQLLVRTRNGSALTPAGSATAEWAAVVLRDMSSLLTGAAALRREEGMHVHLAASMTVAEYLVPGWLRQLARAAPQATVHLEMGNTAKVGELVASGTVEVGFVEGVSLPARMKSKDLLVDELAIVVGVKHPWARRRKPVPATQLAATPLLMREPGSGTRDVLTEELAQHGLEPSVLMELGSTTALKAAAVAGTAPAVLSKLAVAGELASGSLVDVPFEGLELRRVIRAIWTPTHPPSGVVAQLVSLAGANQP